MKFVDEFRNPQVGRAIARDIERLAARLGRSARNPLKIMEACGGHTHAIFKFGLQELLPQGIELVHGPGCPVCVLPVGRIDMAIAIAERPGVVFATFGDAVRVPGSRKTLLQAKAEGADIRTVYSPADALELARALPERRVVFFAIGFETTAPATALTLQAAAQQGIDNFAVFSNHITIVPTLQALLDSPGQQLDGFIGPGHVSLVIGTKPYEFVARRYHKPFVVSGFEPLDVLQSVQMVLAQLCDGRAEVENQYKRLVPEDGNAAALAALADVFELRDSFDWRGLGSIEDSGLRLRPNYARFDAEAIFAVAPISVPDPKACQCGDVLRGLIKPWQCGVFGTACTPETPIGACMVSAEGACAAHYNYGRLSERRARAST